MPSSQKWTIRVNRLETCMRVGCDPKEREPQRIFIDVTIEGEYAAKPSKLDQCINYDMIYQLLVKEWPKLPHTILLETRIHELLVYIFRADDKIDYVKVGLFKPDIFPEVESIGIEAEWTRADFERYGKG